MSPPRIPYGTGRVCIAAPAIVATSLLQGCQTYTPAPLDLPGHRAAIDGRLVDTQPIEAFLARLQDRGDHVPDVFDPSDGVTPAEGEVLALFYNPDLRLARLEAGVSLANWETAGLWKDPVFGFNGVDVISPSGTPFQWALGLSLTIPISGRLDVEKDHAQAAYAVQLQRIIDAEWRIRGTVRIAWARWTAALEQVALIQETIDQLTRLDATVEALSNTGELNRVERRLFRVELAGYDARMAEAQLNVIDSRTALLGVLGLGPESAALLTPALPVITVPECSDTTARLIESNTELAVHLAQYHVAEESLRLEIRKQFPDIVIGPGYGSEFNDHRVMLGLSIPLPILNANRAGIATARADREVARATAETTFDDLDRRLAAALLSIDLAEEQSAAFKGRIVPLLEAQMHDLRAIADLGEIDMFVMLETLTRKLDARMSLLRLQLAQLEAANTAAVLLGPDVPLTLAPVFTAAPEGGSTDPTQGGQ